MAPLHADTDAAALRVADLRAILQQYRIAVPSGARKAALMEAFDAYVRPTLTADAVGDGDAADVPRRGPGAQEGAEAGSARRPGSARAGGGGAASLAAAKPRAVGRRRERRSKSMHLRMLLRWGLWLAAVAWLWYCWGTKAVGFCDSGGDSGNAAARGSALAPRCTPCPDRGVCVDGTLARCAAADCIVEAPLVSRTPLLPYALPLAWTQPVCVPDTYKMVLASELADGIVDYLARWHGDVRCGYSPALSGAPVRHAQPAARVQEALLERTVSDVDHTLFLSLWDMALDGLAEHASQALDVVRGRGGVWLASPQASMPLTCRVRLYLTDFVWRIRVRIAMACVAAVCVAAAWRAVVRARARRARVAGLTRDVYTRLQEQAHAAGADVTPGIPVTNLRDLVLQSEPDAHRRRTLWAHVSRVVEQNANVRTRQVQWHGEWLRVWEWTGVTAVSRGARGVRGGDGSEGANGAASRGDGGDMAQAPHGAPL
ncbi:hypothetical protein MSPP1_000293 [Malassezia sp. CBS 17886]|nr:hypothetical protein MSPP1_000293 [Malassezia sp. CBS 17886]